jgi:hypothetical protein
MCDTWECIYTSDRGIARSADKIKSRETIDAAMVQDEYLLNKLSANSPLNVRMKRWLVRRYKQLR